MFTGSELVVSTYSELKLRWERNPDKRKKYSITSFGVNTPLQLRILFSVFLTLAFVTGDERFIHALEATSDLKLTTDQPEAWAKNLQNPFGCPFYRQTQDRLFELVETFLRDGRTSKFMRACSSRGKSWRSKLRCCCQTGRPRLAIL